MGKVGIAGNLLALIVAHLCRVNLRGCVAEVLIQISKRTVEEGRDASLSKWIFEAVNMQRVGRNCPKASNLLEAHSDHDNT